MKRKISKISKKIVAGILLVTMMAGISACTKSSNAVDDSVSIETIHEAIKDAYGDNYLPDMLLSDDEIMALYGISNDWYEEAIAEVPMISVNVDTLIAVKAEKDHVEDVQNALTSYKEYLENDSFQYPVNVPKIQASTVITRGNYVFFIMLGVGADDIEDQSEDDQVKAYGELNQIAIDAIDGLLLK